jgi:N-methylhydantoinase A
MVRVVRAVSSERGRDPRGFALIVFGGNGPLHGALVAEELGVTRVTVPANPGLFSAWGLLRADFALDFSRTLLARADQLSDVELATAFAELESAARREIAADGIAESDLRIERFVEARYLGQSYELRLDVREIRSAEIATQFAVEHERTYGHAFPGDPVEIVHIGIVARSPRGALSIDAPLNSGEMTPAALREVYFGPESGQRTTPVVGRASIGLTPRSGPLIVAEYDATTVVPPGWTIRRDGMGNLLLEVAA